jgi:catechol 2,3-dioxygenase-like lactoylglutathione lyase family enzyme
MRILELGLETVDVAAQSAFWGNALGVPVGDAGDGRIEIHLAHSTIRFAPASVGADPRYHFAINIPRGSIERAAGWVEERHELLAFHDDPDVEEGATIVQTDRGAATLYFLDAGGNVVELIANHHLDTDRAGPFDAGSLLEIAEIGIATADPGGTRAAIQEALAADVLWGGRPGWQLTAIGDDHGVVIVAPTGRGWIPVGLPAQPHPTSILVEAARACDLTLPEGPYRIRTPV